MFKSNKERILFVILAIVGVILTLNINSALALEMCNSEPNYLDGYAGDECFEFYTQTDFRYYHDSAPGSDLMKSPGGFKLGLIHYNPTPNQLPLEVKFISQKTRMIIEVNEPFGNGVYDFLGLFQSAEYLIWLGNDFNGEGPWECHMNTGSGTPYEFYGIMNPPVKTQKLPVVTLHKMKKGNGGIDIKFSAPAVDGFTRINLRVIDANDNFVAQFKYFDISKAIQDTIPLEWSGHLARFEYRTDYGARTLLYLTFP